MSATAEYKKEKNGQVSIILHCEKCGEPIIKSDKYGMSCKNGCFDKENRSASKTLKKLFPSLYKSWEKEIKKV